MDFQRMSELFGSVIGLGLLAVGVLIMVGLILFLQSCYQRIPPEHRLMSPGLVWLLLIPFFSLIWIFFVYIRLAKSFQRAYAALGRNEGDCGEKLALIFCISCVASLIPFVGCIAGPASLVLLVVVLLKFNTLKNGLPG